MCLPQTLAAYLVQAVETSHKAKGSLVQSSRWVGDGTRHLPERVDVVSQPLFRLPPLVPHLPCRGQAECKQDFTDTGPSTSGLG